MPSTRPRSDTRYVVVGCGGLGAAATYWLSRAVGGRVLTLAPGALGHAGGADGPRILRHAYHQDAYAALAPAAYGSWRDLERVSGQTLVTETGGLVIEDVGSRQGLATGLLGGHAAVADRHGLDFDLLDARGVARRWPQFRLNGTEQAFYQRRTGIVDARRADATHLALARGRGAEIRDHSPVRALRPTATHVEVVLDDEVIRAGRVVVTDDAPTVLDGLVDIPLTVAREQVTHYATPNLLDFSPARFPVFTWHGADALTGVPVHGEVTTALCQYSQHSQHSPHATEHEDTAAEPSPLGRQRRETFLAEHLPGFGGPELSTSTHAGTALPDGHPVIDTVPGEPRVSLAVGTEPVSGFGSLIGRILADLATTGTTRHPIDAFTLARPALTDPFWGRAFHA